MLTLMLLRHAKSSWAYGGLSDFERPLSPRGIAAAPLIGAFIVKNGLLPELVLCSTAVRTRETVKLVLGRAAASVTSVQFEDVLYLASAEDMLARIRRTDGGVKRLMLVGHNPGLHDLAVALTGSGEGASVNALVAKFPTAALAVLNFAGNDWSEIRPASGKLAHFVTPKMLA